MLAKLITNDSGRQFWVRLLRRGDKYGLRDCLTWDENEPCVEFYDATYCGIKNFGPLGQFVSRYYVETLLCSEWAVKPGQGLCLDGGIPEWSLDAAALAEAADFMRDNVNID